MDKEPRDLKGYNRDYYKDHQKAILSARKNRYHSDSTFRNKARLSSIELYRLKNKDRLRVDRRIMVGADGVMFITISRLAQAINKSVHTIRCYHRDRETKTGFVPQVIPEVTHKDSRGYRLYSPYQVGLLRKVFSAFDKGTIGKLEDVHNILVKNWR